MTYNFPIMMIDDREEPAPTIFCGPELGPICPPHHIGRRFFDDALTMTMRCTPMRYPALPLMALHHFLYPLLPDHKVPVESKDWPIPAGIHSQDSPDPRLLPGSPP